MSCEYSLYLLAIANMYRPVKKIFVSLKIFILGQKFSARALKSTEIFAHLGLTLHRFDQTLTSAVLQTSQIHAAT